jgi:hypothetical protein
MTTINIEDFKPKYVGRGQWHVLHVLAAKCVDQEKRNSFVWILNTVINNLLCEECKKHAIEYMNLHWSRDIISSRESLFRFMYDFHLNANKYADKQSPSYEEVRNFYLYNREVCKIKTTTTGNCDTS